MEEQGQLDPVVVGLATFLLILDLILGVYHYTHGGPESGLTEFIMAPLLVFLLTLALISARRPESTGWRIARWVIRGLLVISILLYAFLAVYHFSHEGWRSGIMESAIVATLIALLLRL